MYPLQPFLNAGTTVIYVRGTHVAGYTPLLAILLGIRVCFWFPRVALSRVSQSNDVAVDDIEVKIPWMVSDGVDCPSDAVSPWMFTWVCRR